MNAIQITDQVSVARTNYFVRLNIGKVYILLEKAGMVGTYFSDNAVVTVEDLTAVGRQQVNANHRIEITAGEQWEIRVYFEYETTPIASASLTRAEMHLLFMTLQLQLMILGGAK